MTRFIRGATVVFASLTAVASVPSAIAQSPAWPTKAVRIVVPFPPGGTVDQVARLVGPRLTESLGQQMIIENKAGASGSIGAAQAAKAPADGYTFLFVFDTHAVNPALIPNLPFDTAKDLAPVMLIGTSPMVMTAHPSKPYRTFTDVVNAAKAKPDGVAYGTIGNGSLAHLTMMLLQDQGKFRVAHVPYKGGGPLAQDAIAGHVETAIATIALFAPQVRAGKVRPLAVTGDRRSHALPDVPTLAEQGFPGFSALAWWGVFAPAGTPQPIIDRMNDTLAKALQQPELRKQMTDQLGMDLVGSTPADLQKFLVGEMDRWGKVVREHRIKAD